jgi:predicted aldo/keto reductase-like oxidoreductase
MKYRTFGNVDFQVSALGFGCMRLPTKDKEVDVDEAVRIIRHAIDNGVNYLDTAYPYHGGKSETTVAAALKDGYREKVKIADKMPIWDVKEYDDLDRLLDTQLERLEVDTIDFYLLHNLQAPSWPRMRDLGAVKWLEKVKAEGKIGEMGFSYHDNHETLAEIIDSFDGWSFCQIQYNYVNEDVQAGTKGLEYAADKGLAVVVMEPLLGGCLANPPARLRELFEKAGGKTPADWALKWIWNKPEVATVLSGMSSMQQVEENLASANESGVGTMTDEQLKVVAAAKEIHEELHPIPCTRCGYCMPCPSGVDIPRNLQLYNDATVYEGNQQGLNKNLYNDTPEDKRASSCTACLECEQACPQNIKISEWMPKIHERFKRD